MALMNVSYSSDALSRVCHINILWPEEHPWLHGPVTKPVPVLYLLHGLSDNEDAWLRNSVIERHVQARNLCVVMPNTDRAFYTNTLYHARYYDAIARELPRFLASFLPISQRREDTYVAGLSMGGYGAWKLGLRAPERFSHVISLSGAPMGELMRAGWIERNGADDAFLQEMEHVFGPSFAPGDDVFRLAERVPAAERPRLFSCCGEQDFMFDINTAYKNHLLALGYDLSWRQHAGVAHEWSYWDRMIVEALDWLPAQSRRVRED